MKVFAFSGSLRTGSWNEQLLAIAARGLAARGVALDVWNFKAANVPIYDPDTDGAPPAAVVDFKARVRGATGVLIACPEYNYSYPGALKNLLDFASRPPAENPFKGRVTAQLGATNGPGGTLQAQAMLRHVLAGLGCHTLPGAFTVSRFTEAVDAQGFKEPRQQQTLDAFLDRFVDELRLRSR
ncbi:MAG: NAD(P)H-dependent oxidoreductase [Myxococcaceae bacterium]|nr:NAD(P)H-dependent oxidoreductase [Myxococcaceae bacterium]